MDVAEAQMHIFVACSDHIEIEIGSIKDIEFLQASTKFNVYFSFASPRFVRPNT